MEIRVIDFEILTRHYKVYRDGVDIINTEKEEFLKSIEPIRKEMNAIIASVSSGLIIDQKTQQQKGEEFQKLQSELMEMDNQFKHKMQNMRDDLNLKSYEGLSEIVTNWAKDSSIDLVSGKMEVVYSNPKYESTDEILEILKQQNLFVEFEEKEKED
jgi:Skp family chaperone for outer membrane proteins